MKATLRSVRIAPKKAGLIASMIRGMTVKDAIASLERTNKHGARVLVDLVRSALANAEHNDKQSAENLVIKTITVNKAQTYHRGVPIARGRYRPIRKFLSHIDLTLGVAAGEETAEKGRKVAKEPSQSAKKPVQRAQSSTARKAQKKSSSASADSSKSSS